MSTWKILILRKSWFSRAVKTFKMKTTFLCFSYTGKSVSSYFSQATDSSASCALSRGGFHSSNWRPYVQRSPRLSAAVFYLSHLAGLVNLGLLCVLLHHQSQGVHCVQDLLEGQLDLQEKAVGFSKVRRINSHPVRAGTLDIHEWHWIHNLVLSLIQINERIVQAQDEKMQTRI